MTTRPNVFYWIEETRGPTGKRHTGYAVKRNGDVVATLKTRDHGGYWRFCKTAAERVARDMADAE